ncbi:MAG TPA: TAXI family TRAP transporter solute-binding subunit [Aliidongia sp.]|nr:TAXI family TRAP transporter solute-binding subunit [Aliidongia sp.]
MRAFLALGLLPIAARFAHAADMPDIRFFRIGTGATSGTYFPLGSEMAGMLSSPPGARDCTHGGSCGVPGVIAVTQATQGSVENVGAVFKGTLESALCQADVAAWAYGGTNFFDKQAPMTSLRALANLYSESVHIIVRADSPIKSLKDLKGKRVSMGEPESGTLADARLVLSAAGINEKELKPNFTKLAVACDGLRDGSVDAVFQIAGYPVPAITELASAEPIRLLSVPEETTTKLRKKFPFFTQDTIPAGAYPGISEEAATVGIGAEWITTTNLEPDLAYLLVKALWNANSRRILDGGHPIGKRIALAHAIDGLALPLHPGAERFYREAGLDLDAARPG